ncbi:PIN domain-containing protein [Carboxydochorda subterranea]|uniref:PIN domain-containing protein n=1 Tax=Carboxydichorda subterranea TaxID=3109565 RepID=A0ABZ1BYU7_9FIRM|nr:PIN domain-containing protein [Limnochorda sp. L945t]WRP17690.1 PIN domain-containing protein [Limnochorda sp. L945t]
MAGDLPWLDRLGTGQLRLVLPLALALLGLLAGGAISRWIEAMLGLITSRLHRTPVQDLLWGTVGLVAGLVIAFLLTLPIPRDIPVVGDLIPFVVTAGAAYVGMMVGVRKREELSSLFRTRTRVDSSASEPGASGEEIPQDHAPSKEVGYNGAAPIVLDTSAIIDGRIGDICRTGFLDGKLVVPSFVIGELQRVADSTDPLRRNRGRRGLDMLSRLQKEPRVRVEIVEDESRGDVDQRLVKLARKLQARVVTSDYNLNKVASIHGVAVLNVNELANALKPVVLPGEEMSVQLIRDGKEQGQGVGYLDDGTMIVVDGGRKHIGETVDVTVTSVLQTPAGRLIFARPKSPDRVGRPS